MQQTPTPTEIEETTLDDISGGPHFRNFHGPSFNFQSRDDADPDGSALGRSLNLGNYTGSAE